MCAEFETLRADLSTAHTRLLCVAGQLESSQRNRRGVCGRWSPKDVIAHLVSWDKALEDFLIDPDGFDPSPLYETDKFNARAVSDRHQQSWEETLDEMKMGFDTLNKAMASVAREQRTYRRVCEWLSGRRKDYDHHRNQLEGWIP